MSDWVSSLPDPYAEDQPTPDQLKDARIAALEAALRVVIGTWEHPGPMGTMYQMPRSIDYAKSVLERR